MVTYVSILRAFGSLISIEKCQLLHAGIVKEETKEDPCIGSALVDMYAKFGLLAQAQGVFNELRARDVVSWSALIARYALWGSMSLHGVVCKKCSLKTCFPMCGHMER